MKKEEIIEQLVKAMQDEKVKRQLLPDQYVVAYMHKDTEELIGYHQSTFCQITQDILAAKRYQGTDNANQLHIIYRNFRSMMQPKEDHIFIDLMNNIKKIHFADVDVDDVYIDAIYLADGTEPQNDFNIQVL